MHETTSMLTKYCLMSTSATLYRIFPTIKNSPERHIAEFKGRERRKKAFFSFFPLSLYLNRQNNQGREPRQREKRCLSLLEQNRTEQQQPGLAKPLLCVQKHYCTVLHFNHRLGSKVNHTFAQCTIQYVYTVLLVILPIFAYTFCIK